MFAICDTQGCSNAGAPIPIHDEAVTVICGVCSQPITEVTDTPPALPEDLPPWEL